MELMDISDSVSVLIALIAVAISFATLQQNRNMVEESTRPYISIYYKITEFQNRQHYLIIKNFGQTNGMITNFSCDCDLSKHQYPLANIPFQNIIGTTLCPGQSICTLIKIDCVAKELPQLIFEIEYSNFQKTYKDNVIINLMAEVDTPVIRANTESKELAIISFTLQDFVEKTL